MPTLTIAQIAGQVKYSGDRGAATSFATALPDPDVNGPIMVAIAMAESAGITDNVGGPNRNGSYDYGLWQINGSAHPDLIDPANDNWKDPVYNMQCALTLFKNRGSWRDWSTYNNGLYRTYLLQAQAAWTNPDNSAVVTAPLADAIGGAVDTGVDTAQFLASLSNPQTWARVGLVFGGSVALLVALWLLAAE